MNQIDKSNNKISIKPYPIPKKFANKDMIEQERIINELKRLNKNGAGDTELASTLRSHLRKF